MVENSETLAVCSRGMDARLSEAINSPFSLIQAAVNTASDAWTAAGNAPGDAGLPADWLDNATNEFAAVLAADGAIDKVDTS